MTGVAVIDPLTCGCVKCGEVSVLKSSGGNVEPSPRSEFPCSTDNVTISFAGDAELGTGTEGVFVVVL